MKKALSVLLASLMMLCIFAGCSFRDLLRSDSGISNSDNNSVSDSSSSSSESTAGTDYMSWTAKEWEAASDADKEAAVMALMKFMMEDNGISMTDDMLASAVEPQMDTLLSSLDTAFSASDTLTLQSFAEMSSSAMSSMLGE